MRKTSLFTALGTGLVASPAFAASGPFFSLNNTDFIVLLAFLLFIAVLIYFKVPGMLAGLLDKRAEGIQAELDEARQLREEAQSLLATYERKQREVQDHADRIVAQAREDAQAAADKAKDDIARSIERRLVAAEEQIAQAHASAVKDVRNTAVQVAVAAAREVISSQTSKADGSKLIDDAIQTVGQKLH